MQGKTVTKGRLALTSITSTASAPSSRSTHRRRAFHLQIVTICNMPRAALILFLAVFPASRVFAQEAARLDVDATDAPRRLLHVKLTLPVVAGPLTLLYPQWIP